MVSRKHILIGLVLATVGGAIFLFVAARAPDDANAPSISSAPVSENAPDTRTPGSAVAEEPPAYEAPETLPEEDSPERRLLYTIPITVSGTALDAMREYSADSAHHFLFTSRMFAGLGEFIESINGVRNENGFYWTLLINGMLSEYGVSSLPVAPGDTLEWRYQKGP